MNFKSRAISRRHQASDFYFCPYTLAFRRSALHNRCSFHCRRYRIKEAFPDSNNRPVTNGNFIPAQNLEGGNNDGFVDNPDATYKMVEFIIGYNLLISGYKANLSLLIYNLVNEEYRQLGNEYSLMPGMERNIQLNLSPDI